MSTEIKDGLKPFHESVVDVLDNKLHQGEGLGQVADVILQSIVPANHDAIATAFDEAVRRASPERVRDIGSLQTIGRLVRRHLQVQKIVAEKGLEPRTV